MDVPVLAKVWIPVHVGAIACDSAGAESERMSVVATPLTAVRPMVAEGLASPDIVAAPTTMLPLKVAVPVPWKVKVLLSAVFPNRRLVRDNPDRWTKIILRDSVKASFIVLNANDDV